jgi:nucleotide-binding universal stress UspA family protein
MNTLLIPIDFTIATENALQYGVEIAKNHDFRLHLLHLISSENDRSEAEQILNDLLSKYQTDSEDKIQSEIVVGNIESDIGKTAEKINASFILMGTHENSTLSKIFGSKAIKVVSESKTPYITIQEKGDLKTISKIAMTIDLEKESIQIVEAAIELAKQFGSEIILVGGAHTDPTLKAKVAINVKTTRRLLAESGIKSSVELLARKDFLDNFINYCSNYKVDLIAATYYPDTFTVFSTKFVQKLLENKAGIPVLTLDSLSVAKGGYYSF